MSRFVWFVTFVFVSAISSGSGASIYVKSPGPTFISTLYLIPVYLVTSLIAAWLMPKVGQSLRVPCLGIAAGTFGLLGYWFCEALMTGI